MSVSYRIQDYIADRRLPWDPVPHAASNTCLQAAHSAHLPAERVAKAVVLKDDLGYVLAVVRADREVHLGEVDAALGRRHLRFAPEHELGMLFADQPEVYFEGGDHRTLVHM